VELGLNPNLNLKLLPLLKPGPEQQSLKQVEDHVARSTVHRPVRWL